MKFKSLKVIPTGLELHKLGVLCKTNRSRRGGTFIAPFEKQVTHPLTRVTL